MVGFAHILLVFCLLGTGAIGQRFSTLRGAVARMGPTDLRTALAKDSATDIRGAGATGQAGEREAITTARAGTIKATKEGIGTAGDSATARGDVEMEAGATEGTVAEAGNMMATESDTLRVMFWNVENFFEAGGFEGHSWSKRRFYSKCGAVAKTILLTGDSFGWVPDVIGFAEVGSRNVLKALLYSTVLRKLDYSIVHYESPDRRGIDCGLIYRRSSLNLVSSKPCHIYDSLGTIMATRDILLAVFERKSDERTKEDKTANKQFGGRVISGDGGKSSGCEHVGGTVSERKDSRDSRAPSEQLGVGEKTGDKDFGGSEITDGWQEMGEGDKGPAEQIAVLINHHPSKLGKGSGNRRQVAMDRLFFVRDSLLAQGVRQIIAVGDFNETFEPAPNLVRAGSVIDRVQGNSAWGGVRAGSVEDVVRAERKKGAKSSGIMWLDQQLGTIKFQGKWEQIDGCIILDGLQGVEYILDFEMLSTKDSYGGVKPRRTFSGPRYLGGISDHYPVFYLIF